MRFKLIFVEYAESTTTLVRPTSLCLPDREPSHWLDGGVLITATKCFTYCQYLSKYLNFSIYRSIMRNYIKFLLGYKLLNSPVCLHVQAIYVHGAKPNGR